MPQQQAEIARANLSAQIAALDAQLYQLVSVRAPFAGRVERIQWEEQNDQVLSVVVFLLLLTPVLIAEAQTPKLPCATTSAECVAMLGDLAVSNSLELQTLNRAIAFQQKKVWTAWMNADGWNPLAVGMRFARNLVGGGDRAAIKLEIANLERRRAEVESALRLQVANALADIEEAGRRRRLAQSKSDNHWARMRLIEAGYRLGAGSTEEMLQLWSTSKDLHGQVA